MVGGGARSAAYRHALADLCDLPVVVADADQAVAAGACVQAAAVLEQVAPHEIARRWGLGQSQPVERTAGVSADAVEATRAAYAARRDRDA